MDLSRVVLPTFILEPRSLLQKFADYYFHADILSRLVNSDYAFTLKRIAYQELYD